MNLYDFKVMTRKGEEVSLDEYKEYAKRRSLSKLQYIDDTGEVTVFDF